MQLRSAGIEPKSSFRPCESKETLYMCVQQKHDEKDKKNFINSAKCIMHWLKIILYHSLRKFQQSFICQKTLKTHAQCLPELTPARRNEHENSANTVTATVTVDVAHLNMILPCKFKS